MENLVSCEDFLGRCEFKSYSEFLFMMCVAKEYQRLGRLLDISMMTIDKELLGKQQLLLFQWLVYRGVVYSGSSLLDQPMEDEPYVFNMEAITANEGNLFLDVEGDDPHYEWNNTWAKQQRYGDYDNDLYLLQYMGNILLHITAHMIVGIREGKFRDKPIKIILDGIISRTTSIYLDIMSCRRTIDWFARMVELEIGTEGENIDSEFYLFINDGIIAGRRQLWSIGDKKKQLEKVGIVEGSICVLYERNGLADINPVGKITNSNIVRVNSITDDSVCVTIIPLYRSKEEIEEDYLSIPEESRNMFIDMLDYKVNLYNKELSLYSLGIHNYLYEECLFICPIDEYGTVRKLVTIDNKRGMVELSQRNAIYWLLCQYDVEFDRELYKLMYNNSKPLLWDEYNL